MSSHPQSAPIDIDWDEEIPRPDVSNLITEDDTPVDNPFSEKQMRLLTSSLYASWKPDFPFVTMANVGVYVALNRPAVVPDVLVTTHVEPLQDLMDKEHRAYFSWLYNGKPPDIVVEIVSNRKGREMDSKRHNYEHMRVPWYVVFDPACLLKGQLLTVFGMNGGGYVEIAPHALGAVGLGLALWEGEFEGVTATWLRWLGGDGELLKLATEREAETLLSLDKAKHEANKAKHEAFEAKRKAEEAKREASASMLRASALAAKLRALGIDPDSLD